MKSLVKTPFILLCMLMVTACSKQDEIYESANGINEELSALNCAPGERTITVPFKTDFTVWNHTNPEDDWCGDEPGVYSLTMKGEGNINHLGHITTTMTFCNRLATGEYWDTDVVFVAANGDELYASIPVGLIVPNEEENSNFYRRRFNDDMFFIGGTGRFEDASGMAKTNAFVHYPTDDWLFKGDSIWHTDFFSTGELVLQKGRRNKGH